MYYVKFALTGLTSSDQKSTQVRTTDSICMNTGSLHQDSLSEPFTVPSTILSIAINLLLWKLFSKCPNIHLHSKQAFKGTKLITNSKNAPNKKPIYLINLIILWTNCIHYTYMVNIRIYQVLYYSYKQAKINLTQRLN